MQKIVFSGGCFWGVEAYFNRIKGVVSTNVGYANGNKENPTYEEICDGIANHAEAVEVSYDENLISLNTLLDHFFRIVNPYSFNKQGNDTGIQYRSGIYYSNEDDHLTIRTFIANKQREATRIIVVELKPLLNYYKAEEYHQEYLFKNPNGYCHVDMSLLLQEESK